MYVSDGYQMRRLFFVESVAINLINYEDVIIAGTLILYEIKLVTKRLLYILLIIALSNCVMTKVLICSIIFLALLQEFKFVKKKLAFL